MTELAAYACRQEESRGRRHREAPPGGRSEYQRDRDRIVHCAAFRRLEYKTQVFVNHEGDMFRTRLTHSLEVAQIGRSIARTLRLNEDLVEAIALAHDLGHTPFGHAGQDILNECMQAWGGFEHNLQSLRVVDELEQRYAEFDGLNLTFETRAGILKHCSLKMAQTLGEVAARFITREAPSLEAQLSNIADEIAYNNHDVDDGLRAELLTLDQLREVPWCNMHLEEVGRAYPKLSTRRTIHEVIRRMINAQITDLVNTTRDALQQHQVDSAAAVRALGRPLVGFSEPMAVHHRALKQFLRDKLYRHYHVQRMTFKARHIVKSLFEVFLHEPRLLPPQTQRQADGLADTAGDAGRARAIADYIAGMTDRYAMAEYDRVFYPGQST